MELPLQPSNIPQILLGYGAGFNPCFNGTTSATQKLAKKKTKKQKGFNPCFNGTTSATLVRL